MKKNVCVVGTVGIPACYGGFESLVENLTLNSSKGVNYTVFCSEQAYPTKKTKHNRASLHYLPLKANGVQSIFYDVFSLIKCWKLKPDVILILGVSGCLFLPVFRLFSQARIVTNIDGLEWKRAKWGVLTKKFLKLSEHVAVICSDVVITDNQAISDYVLSEYSVESFTIAYGGDHALREVNAPRKQQKYALGLCRIEPENNVDMVLEAFSKTNKVVKFVGNWNSSEFGKSLRFKYKDCQNIELLDPIYDLDELYVLRTNCSLYLHGHSAGGTNPSLVEMMHFGVPILAFDCSFNRYSTEDRADYFSNDDGLLAKLDLDDNSLEQNALDMKEIASRRYTWKEITSLYEKTFY